MFDLLKEDMVCSLERLTFESLDAERELVMKQFDILISLRDVKQQKQALGLAETPKEDVVEDAPIVRTGADVVPEDANEDATPTESVPETTDLFDTPAVYTFERKIRGGMVNEVEGYVPEGIVRRLGLEHGDKVHATPKETSDPNRNFFMYALAEKGPGGEAPGRTQHNYCPVKKEAGRYLVERSAVTGEAIRFNESLYTVILDDSDVLEHKIKVGDLIDIAYPNDKPNMAKVLWKHDVEALKVPPTTNNNNASEKVEAENPKEEPGQTLEGKAVLVIGNEPKKELYKEAIEERGGEFLWADAKLNLTRLRAMVRKADVVCFLLSVSGHIGMEHIKKMCKDYKVPFETSWSMGRSSVVRIAEDAAITA